MSDIGSVLNKQAKNINFLVIAIVLGAIGFSRAALSNTNQIVPTRIGSKSFSSVETDELAQLLGIKVGLPLSRSKIDQEIKKVFLGGKYGEVRVVFEPKNRQQVVFIEGVRLKKLGQVDWSQVETTIREETGIEKMLVPGQKVDIKELRQIEQRIQVALEDRGYRDPKVDYEVVPTSDENVSDIRFIVVKADRLTIQQIVFRGVDKDFTEGLASRLRVREGAVFDKNLIEKSVQQLMDFLRDNQYPGAKVKWLVEKNEATPNLVSLVIDISVGLRYRFLFRGNEVLDQSVLRSLIGLELLGQADASNKIKRVLEEKYRALGYHFARIDVVVGEKGSDGIVTVSIVVAEGAKVLVDSVVFDGLWSEKLGNPSIRFFENAVGVLRRRIYWEEGVKESTERFVNNLREMGFLSASVTGPRVFFSDDRKGVQLFYDLQLGNLYEIKQITFKGNENVPTHTLMEVVSFKVGDTLNKEVLKSNIEVVRAKVQSSGFLDVKVVADEKSVEGASGNRVEGIEIGFQIEEGPRYTVGTVNIEGLVRTQEKVVRREILIQPGEPFDPEKVRQTEENISLLGLFSRAEALTSSSIEEPRVKNVVFVLSEIKPGFGEVGLGALYEDPLFRARSFLGVGYRNLLGLNQTASIRSEVSLPISRSNVLIPFVEYAALLNYRAPYLADLPFTFSVQGGFTSFQVASSADGRQSDLQTKARLEERIERRLSKRVMAQYRLHRLERTRTEVIERKDSGDTVRLNDTVDVIGSTGPTLMVDFRNDLFNPTSGSLHSLDLEFAHPSLLASQELAFLLALQRNSFYFPISKSLNLSVFVGAGWSRALLSRGLPEARLANELALGGQTSIRGYAPRLFRAASGVRELAFYNIRTELSIPLFGEVSGALFFDTGQLFPELKADSRNDGVGVGVRYRTPVGPVVLDLAHGLSPAAKSMVRFTFTVGSI